MAEDHTDDSQKTEDPTQRRIEQAREKGQVARSQEINHWFIILAMTLLVTIFAAPMARGVVGAMHRFIERPHAIRLDGYHLREVLTDMLTQLGLAMLVSFETSDGAYGCTKNAQRHLFTSKVIYHDTPGIPDPDSFDTKENYNKCISVV